MPLPPLEYVEVLVVLDPARGETGHAPLAPVLASSHSGVRNAVPQSGFATPWSPAAPNSAEYQKPCS